MNNTYNILVFAYLWGWGTIFLGASSGKADLKNDKETVWGLSLSKERKKERKKERNKQKKQWSSLRGRIYQSIQKLENVCLMRKFQFKSCIEILQRSSNNMYFEWVLWRWGGIGVWDKGQAGPCMGRCMGGAKMMLNIHCYYSMKHWRNWWHILMHSGL